MNAFWLTLLFVWFLYPVGLDEFSVNYSFVLLPALMVLVRQRLLLPPPLIRFGIGLYVLIFAISLVYYLNEIPQALRRFSSFVVFMAMFTYAIIHIRPRMVAAFKWAIILVSTLFALLAITTFFELAALGPVHFEAKNEVGSQRFGYVYVAGFWLALLQPQPSRKLRLLSLVLLPVIAAGAFLTFSRSSVIALAGSLALFTALKTSQGFLRPTLAGLRRFVALSAGVALVGTAIFLAFPLTIEYYASTLVDPLLDARLFDAMTTSTSSEGIRVVRVAEGLDYVLQHPFTGTGFLGIWSISPTGGGSAHNQLLDTFIRVGIPGFLFYVYLLYRVTRFLARHDQPLFWAMVGILIYGFFHETFKDSQGGFMLAFMIGMLAQDARDRRASRHAAPERREYVPPQAPDPLPS